MQEDLSMDKEFIQKLYDILEVNFENEQFGVNELSEEIGVSHSQLHRKLQSIEGKSASRFISHYRLQKALEMLQKNVATASEISYRVGFASPTYFNTCFREFYGFPPGEVKFRKVSAKKENEIFQNKKSLSKSNLVIISSFILIVFVTTYYFYNKSENKIASEITETEIKDKSIAVLPFKNLSDNSENQYFADGVMEVILNHLSSIKELKVISRTSTEQYRETTKTSPEIAEELGVSYILEASVQKDNDQIRIIAQLIDAKNDQHIWSIDIKKDYKNIFELQSTIAKQILKELNAELSDAERNQIDKKPTNNLEAYRLFIQAEYLKNQFNESAFKEAIPLYERAIQLDPNFTDAYISFGQYWSYGGLVWGIFNEQEAWDKAKLLFERALELDPTNYTVALELHSGYFYYDWNFADFEIFIKEVNETETFDKSEYLIFSDFSLKIGKFDEVILFCESEIKKFPLNSIGYIHLSWSLFLSGNKDRSNEVIDSSQSMFTDDLHYLMESSRLYYYLGDYKNSKKLLDILMNNFKDRPPLIIWLNAVFANVEKNSESAQNNLDKLHQLYNDKVSGSPAWFIALYYCHIKDYEKAFEWLQKSYDRHEVEMTWLKEEPLLRPLRSDPRYIELYDKVGFSKIAPITPYVN